MKMVDCDNCIDNDDFILKTLVRSRIE